MVFIPIFIRLNLNFNCSSNFALSSVDRNSTEMQKFVAVTSNGVARVVTEITQFLTKLE